MSRLETDRAGPAFRLPASAVHGWALVDAARYGPAALALTGFAATLVLFWPGLMSHDAAWVHATAMGNAPLGDWQSPVMAMLWRLIDPLSPGPGSMLLLTAALYWFGFGLVANAVARQSWLAAVLVIAAALTPPSLVMLGVIWRDMLLAALWIAACALAMTTAQRGGWRANAIRAAALGFVVLGVLLRPNAILAGALLALYVIWPARFAWRRVALLLVPVAVLLAGLSHVTYYNLLGASKQGPLRSLVVFDLGGIMHFSGDNVFPIAWTDQQQEMLTTQCYGSDMWDRYWYMPPCSFVMDRLENEDLFHSPVIVDAWRAAVAKYPLAYLRHRLAFMENFLFAQNQTLPVSRPGPANAGFKPSAAYDAYVAAHEALKATPVFRIGFWFAACLIVCVFAWPRRDTVPGAFALAVAGSAVLYVAYFAALGVAADFRYGYWAVPAALAGAALLVPARRGLRA